MAKKKYKVNIPVILVIILIIFFIIRCIIYMQENKKDIQNFNSDYQNLEEKTISEKDLASLINKTLDKNTKNDISLNIDGSFIDNKTNSINMEIKFKDSDKYFPIYKIKNYGLNSFLEVYKNTNFKCTVVNYHKNGKISYLLFEEQ